MSQDEFNQKVIEHLIALGERLESIERMLKSESHWDNRVLGASEEHAELSTLELPATKQEPEWRPMSTAPRDGTTIMGGFRDPHDPGGNICIEEPIYWLGSYANNWFHRDGNNVRPVMIWKVMNTLKGWRPL